MRTPTCPTQRTPPPQKARRRGGMRRVHSFLSLRRCSLQLAFKMPDGLAEEEDVLEYIWES